MASVGPSVTTYADSATAQAAGRMPFHCGLLTTSEGPPLWVLWLGPIFSVAPVSS